MLNCRGKRLSIKREQNLRAELQNFKFGSVQVSYLLCNRKNQVRDASASQLPGCEDLVGEEKPASTTEGHQMCSGISGLCIRERRLPYVPLGISWNDNGLLSVPSC